MLVGTAPTYNENRDLLAFANGFVYNWTTEKMAIGEAWMHITKTLPYAYKAWPKALWKEYNDIVRDIYERFSTGKRGLQPDDECDDEERAIRQVIYNRVAEVCKKDRFLLFLWQISNYNLDDWAYLNQQFCRMESSCPRFNEMLYMWGPSGTGKDTVAAAIEAQFGTDFAGGLPKGFLVKEFGARKKGASEECTPFKNALAGKRVCVVPEHPKECDGSWKGAPLDMDLLLDMTDQCGAKTTTRGIKADPTRSNPSYLVLVLSNGAPNPSMSSDEARRRMCSFPMQNRFKEKPEEGEEGASATLKLDLSAGKYNSSFFEATRPWYKCLMLYETNIAKSPNVKEASVEAFEAPAAAAVVPENPLLTLFEPTGDATRAMKEAEVKAVLMKLWNLPKGEATTRGRDGGFIFGLNGGRGKRYATYGFPDGRAMVAAKTM